MLVPYRSDFAHLQAYFLEFLDSPASQQFLQGDDQNPPLKYVLVDEYQDTNPIQERIYLALVGQSPHNITVVGDDDQALYRFRGGNVTCMVNFDKACQAIFNEIPHQIQLENNYRSHPDIVDFFNQYITSFPEMNVSGVRAPNKQPVIAASSISGDYPAVSWIQTKKVGDLANAVGNFIQNHLIADGIISDLSQCVLLLRSAKDSERNAGPFIQAFQNLGISIYNPRSKSFMDSEEVQCLLASLVQVIDQNHSFASRIDPQGRPLSWVETVQGWFRSLGNIRNDPNISTNSLDNYLNKSNTELLKLYQQKSGSFLKLNLLEIIYRILAQKLDETLARFKRNLYQRVTRTPEDLAIEDDIRLIYVAYSRAQYGLILVGTKDQIKNHIAVPSRNHLQFKRNTEIIII